MEHSAAVPDIGALNTFATETILQLGDEALQYYGKGRLHPPFDQDLVTQAELHLNNSFQNKISVQFPDHQVFGKDPLGEGYTHGAKRYMWVFDPLDGVDNFQTRIPIWGMSLALYENNWPVLGCFYMPATEDLFRAIAGQQAYWNDLPLELPDRGDLTRVSLVLTFSRFHQHYRFQFPGKVRALGSTGVHICYVAMGRADAAITAHESFKDLAAVRIIVEAVGGKLYKADGSAIFIGDFVDGTRIDDHLIIAPPSNAERVLESLQPVG